MYMNVLSRALIIGLLIPSCSVWADWSNSNIQVLSGDHFHEPGNGRQVGKQTLTLETSHGFEWGSSYAFVDFLKSDAAEAHANEYYAEAYVSPSLRYLTKQDWSFAGVKDVALSAGVNVGNKETGANPQVLLLGTTFKIDSTVFSYVDLSVYRYFDRGVFQGQPSSSQGDAWQVTPVWGLPFSIGLTQWVFEGFVDYITAHGGASDQVMSQPQLKLDVGALFDMPKRLYGGVEYQYWRNKYGIRGLNDEVPQLLLVWQF